jgi:hypothetical protein
MSTDSLSSVKSRQIQHADIPVPRYHSAATDPETGGSHPVLKLAEGDTLKFGLNR